MISEFYIASFTAEELKSVERLNEKYRRGRAYTKADAVFDKWLNEEAQRQYGEREALKAEGWSIAYDSSLTVEERARGVEMVIYSHWHRADPKPPMTPEQYAGCWLEANGEELVSERLKDPAILALLRSRYPLTGNRRLKPGYTYVWNK